MKIVFIILRFLGIPFLLREIFQRNRVTIILFHDMDPKIFSDHVQKLKKLYNIISLQEYISFRQENRKERLPKKSLVLTFDDGHLGNYALLPVIKEHKIPVTIFLCSHIINSKRHFWYQFGHSKSMSVSKLKKVPDKSRLIRLEKLGYQEENEYKERQALNSEEINQMREFIDFQSHTKFHPILPYCSDERSFSEIKESKEKLEKDFKLSINTISYPNGDYSDREIEYAQKSGYSCGVTVDSGFNSNKTDLFRLKRFSVRDNCDINELVVKASGFWGFVRLVFRRQDWGYKKSIKDR
jgi:peptidoglycan/xylan/chitin deacetylase (PgdA/CDA1 family)